MYGCSKTTSNITNYDFFFSERFFAAEPVRRKKKWVVPGKTTEQTVILLRPSWLDVAKTLKSQSDAKKYVPADVRAPWNPKSHAQRALLLFFLLLTRLHANGSAINQSASRAEKTKEHLSPGKPRIVNLNVPITWAEILNSVGRDSGSECE